MKKVGRSLPALDPWFLYGGFGVPAMGIAGIAWANGGDPRRRKFGAADGGDQAETIGAEHMDRFVAKFESLL